MRDVAGRGAAAPTPPPRRPRLQRLPPRANAGALHFDVASALPPTAHNALRQCPARRGRRVSTECPLRASPAPSIRPAADLLQLHLATCANNVPHISLMNYTYLPTTPYSPHPTIIMTTPPSSQKTHNLESNPLVSLLGTSRHRSPLPPRCKRSSSLETATRIRPRAMLAPLSREPY
jgi:hypothetical protein